MVTLKRITPEPRLTNKEDKGLTCPVLNLKM